MGCDGGTIPRRDELVRTKKKPEQKDPNADKDAKWKNCALTQLPLRAPLVACRLGRLYNKIDLIQALIDNRGPSHIKKLRTDTCDLNLGEKTPTSDDFNYVCPVTGLEMNGNYKFFVIWTCGCVISERAFRLVSSSSCMNCGKPFTSDDLITLNPDEEESKILENRLHAKIRSKKEKILDKQNEKTEKEQNTSSKSATTSSECSHVKKHNVEKQNVASVDTAVKCNESKTKSNPGNTSTTNLTHGKRSAPSDDTKKVVGIQQNPNCSSVYKSIFNSCEAAKRQKTAHWTTYNPLYF